MGIHQGAQHFMIDRIDAALVRGLRCCGSSARRHNGNTPVHTPSCSTRCRASDAEFSTFIRPKRTPRRRLNHSKKTTELPPLPEGAGARLQALSAEARSRQTCEEQREARQHREARRGWKQPPLLASPRAAPWCRPARRPRHDRGGAGIEPLAAPSNSTGLPPVQCALRSGHTIVPAILEDIAFFRSKTNEHTTLQPTQGDAVPVVSTCSDCGLAFASKEHLRCHLARVHQVPCCDQADAIETQAAVVTCCTSCGLAFSSLQCLIAHEVRIHGSEATL